MKGKYSIEKLLHLSCFNCKKWWTIGDGNPKKTYICPNCGQSQKFEKAEPLK